MNAALQARLEAGARHERTLESVALQPVLGPAPIHRTTRNSSDSLNSLLCKFVIPLAVQSGQGCPKRILFWM